MLFRCTLGIQIAAKLTNTINSATIVGIAIIKILEIANRFFINIPYFASPCPSIIGSVSGSNNRL